MGDDRDRLPKDHLGLISVLIPAALLLGLGLLMIYYAIVR